ncbi:MULTISPECIES: PspC domain-containing protein [unclassified Clostridium]|uniref:PspC domain-containing protein n=1 Tax=unclassified Clostridium TaxID=2614128 RepID=UPI00023B0350|nr:MULTISPECIES: PspC domain-containing protein [unclassified Clostridium]EHJ01813.1 phage shock protein C, PspC [Clostridium sp. DL-VIII]OOM73483.1 DNA-binding transcriptional activator PspC [Clostridium sp. BL-8]
MFENKKLYKDVSRKKICGVLVGVSDYISGDVTLVRILFILLSIKFLPVCIVIYFICALIMPDKQDIFKDQSPNQ